MVHVCSNELMIMFLLVTFGSCLEVSHMVFGKNKTKSHSYALKGYRAERSKQRIKE